MGRVGLRRGSQKNVHTHTKHLTEKEKKKKLCYGITWKRTKTFFFFKSLRDHY